MVPTGAGVPHSTLSESRIAQATVQNRSTEPKNNGASTSTAIVIQSWTDRNVSAGSSNGIRRIIAMRSGRSARSYQWVLTAVCTLLTASDTFVTEPDVLSISVSSL